VVLYLSEGLAGSALTQVPTSVPVFDQKNCVYTPHVLAMDVNQNFKVANSDQTSHNIHPNPNPMTGNIPWNLSQPPGAPPIEKSWKAEEVAIPVQCNIHPWMHGWLVVVKGPYATTDSNGNYTIENVPPGNYTVTAWQEDYGTQTQKSNGCGRKTRKCRFHFQAEVEITGNFLCSCRTRSTEPESIDSMTMSFSRSRRRCEFASAPNGR